MGIFWMVIILGGNFPGGIAWEGAILGGNFPDGNCPGGSYPA